LLSPDSRKEKEAKWKGSFAAIAYPLRTSAHRCVSLKQDGAGNGLALNPLGVEPGGNA
jgi:hypothetical protein